jgi:hypothetical protein
MIRRKTLRPTVLATLFVLALAGCAWHGSTALQRTAASASADSLAPEREAIVATIQKLFDGMATRDTALLRSVVLSGAVVIAQAAGSPTRRTTDSAWISGLGAGKDRLLERWWNPTVHQHNTVAMVWTPYDFHINGKFTHCGVDAFTLVRTTDGWKIASITYTRETTGCPVSPLGPPSTN